MKVRDFIDHRIRVVSFDIFDTVVTRNCAEPKDVFYELGNILKKKNIIIDNFAEKRIRAEYDARILKHFQKEVTIDEIYRQMNLQLKLPQVVIDSAIGIEMQVEETFLVPVRKTLELVAQVKQLQKDVIFISDMYLPDEFIYKILSKYKVIQNKRSLYVSSTTGLLKSTGELFRYVAREQNIKLKELCHIGDNIESDYRIPRKLGIRSVRYQEALPNRYEMNMAALKEADRIQRSKLSAICRIHRLTCPYTDKKRQTIWDVSSNVSGPLLIGYVKWCLDSADCLGLSRLYFMSRDGQVLLKIAKVLNRQLKYPIDLRYLYVSRQALLLPSVIELNNEALEWILAPTSLLTLRIIFKRVGISIEKVEKILEQYKLLRRDWDKNLNEKKQIKKLFSDENLRKLIIENAKTHRESTFGYLKQEGLTRDDKYALVDIGWNGTLQRSVSRILEQYGYAYPVKGYYFGLRNRKKHKDHDQLWSYFSDYKEKLGLDKIVYLVPMIELFVAADHAGVLAYDNNQNKYLPILNGSNAKNNIDWGVQTQQEAIICLANALLSCPEAIYDLLQVDLLSKNLSDFMLNPTRCEAVAYGSYQLAEDQNESYFLPMAKKYSIRDLIKHYASGYSHHHNEWVQGAMAMSNRLLRYLCGIKLLRKAL